MTAAIAQLVRYPVKSMQGEMLESVSLTANRIFPGDRQFAVAHKASAWDAMAPGWRPKNDFVNLTRVEKMAALTARMADDGMLEIQRGGTRATGGDPHTPTGRAVMEQFLSAFLKDVANGPVRLAEAQENALTDVPVPFVSMINLASVRDLERVTHRPVDPNRFRGNILIDGAPPWAEFDWIGKDVAIGDVTFRIDERIGRCAATGVNPDTAKRDLNIVRTLSQNWRHTDMGVYATVLGDGVIRTGDDVRPV